MPAIRAPEPAPDPPGGESAAELKRLRAEAVLRARLTDITLGFSRGVSTAVDLASALKGLADQTASLFGAGQVSVWLHHRRERELVLAATSGDARQMASRIAASDSRSLIARGLRLERAERFADLPVPVIVVPLRGLRRALGAAIIEAAAAPDLDDAQIVELADELGRQLSVAIESIQLLEEIIRQRLLLEDTFNSLLDLVVVTDNRNRIVQTNDAFAARIGQRREELIDREFDALVGRELARWALALDTSEQRAEQAGLPRTRRLDDPQLGGVFSATVTPLINRDGNPVGRVLVARDITMQTRLEAEREALRERLGQSEKLASLGQFIAGIAHEMNNPLQGVLGHLELLMETADLPSATKKDLRGIYREANRAARIVNNLLAFSGSHRRKRRRLRIDRVIARVVSSRATSLRRKGIQVVREFPADLPSINGDPLLLHQAFLNIVVNAEHAMDGGNGGRLELRAACDDRATVVVTIRDTGPGIPADILPRVFDPFFTTKEVGQGTGLGLAITYGIIQEHGGVVHAGDADGGGAEFTIELPAAR
jgi:two-component system, NtrC family, sensor kinase